MLMKRLKYRFWAIVAMTMLPLGSLASETAMPLVKPGVEVLREHGFAELKGKRIALITNPTGVDYELKSTIDILNEAPKVTLCAIFAPEHGARGDVAAGQSVATYTDKATGVKVWSLYGKTRRPTPEMLEGVDAVVYDIQDIGCRSYTFISTMGLAMEECARHGKEFVVLDRPNPLGGNKVEGGGVDPDCISFVSQFDIPYIYGLTPGELAQMLVGEGLIKLSKPLKLTVVPMEGWQRSMLYGQTGLPWVLPSPHIPVASTALFYPASGIAGELDYLSIGVGYTLPFRTFAAPWIDGRKLAQRLKSLSLPGFEFRPVSYKPYYGFAKGENLQGVEFYVTDYEAAELSLLQFYVMQELAAMYPAHKASAGAVSGRFGMFDKVTGSKRIRQAFFKRHRVEDILDLWNAGRDGFIQKKEKYHLYK